VKIEHVQELLRQINHTIETELEKYPTIKQEIKPFKPHLTIARARRNRNPSTSHPQNSGQQSYSDLKDQYRDRLFGDWDIARVVLKQSTLTPTGPIYSNLTFE
jgi:2'-5' RNA ligase